MNLNPLYYQTENYWKDTGIGYTKPINEIGLPLNTPWDNTNVWCENKGVAWLGSGLPNVTYLVNGVNTIFNPDETNTTPELYIPNMQVSRGNDYRVKIRWALGTYYYGSGYYGQLSILQSRWGYNLEEQIPNYTTNLDYINFITEFNPNKLLCRVVVAVLDIDKYLNGETYRTDYFLSEVPELTDRQCIINIRTKFYYGDAGSRIPIPITPIIELSTPDTLGYSSFTSTDLESSSDNFFFFGTHLYLGYYTSYPNSYSWYTGGSISVPSYPKNDTVLSGDYERFLTGSAPPEFRMSYNDFLSNTAINMGSYITLANNNDITNKHRYVLPRLTKSDVEKIISSLGIYWTGYNDPQMATDDARCNLGYMSDDGVTDGTFTSGIANKDGIQNEMENFTDTPYNGTINTNPDNTVNEIELSSPKVSPVNAFSKYYAVNLTNIRNLADWLYNTDDSIFEGIINGLKLYGENPIEGLVSLRMYPFRVPYLFNTVSDTIQVGRVNSGISALALTDQKTAVFDMGEAFFTQKYQNFLDLSPYTELQLYLPYCGTIDISPTDVLGKRISVKYIVDITTGACTAVVYFDNMPFIYKNGTIGVNISMTATNNAQFANSVLSSSLSLAGSVLQQNPLASAENALQLATSAKTTFQKSGSSSSAIGNWLPQNCYFIISRPLAEIPENYGHTVGYMCMDDMTISQCDGFTICRNVDTTGIPCTETERQLIQNILQSGFFA